MWINAWPAAILLAFSASASGATALTTAQTLREFNLITLGSATIGSHVDGRTLVGGGLTGNGAVFAMHPADMPSSAYAGLTVLGGTASNLQVQSGGATFLGSISNVGVNNGPVVVQGSASNSSFNGSGGSWVGGTRSGVNSNSGSLDAATASQALAQATATDFATQLTTLSDQLATLASTGSWWEVSGNRVTFHAVADASGLAVFDLTAVDDTLLAKGEFVFDFASASTVVLNSDVTSATVSANFLTYAGTSGSIAQQIAAKTVWNFHSAQSLTFTTQFSGTVLGVEAALTNTNNIEGGVFVETLDQRGEIHLQPFTATLPTFASAVPEPGGLPLAAAGLALLALLALHRRRRTAPPSAGA